MGTSLANQTPLFEASLCRPTAPGLPIWGTGDFGTSPIFEQLSDKPLLASNQISGVRGRKAQWRIEILMPTKKRFLNYFSQPDKLICALIWLHVKPTFKIMHRRGA